MRVLLDENLDHALGKLLGPHNVATVTYMGWAGLWNGDLLEAAEKEGFQVFLTGDQTPPRHSSAFRHPTTDHQKPSAKNNCLH